MDGQRTEKRGQIWLLISGLFVLGYITVLSLRHDFWYDLNDDVMIQKLTSGVYTGEPLSHNIQMQYPLSLFLSLLYRLIPQLPWYALFLVVIQALCIIMILFRTSEMFEEKIMKVVAFIEVAAILCMLLTKHMVLYQYTVSCAFLSATSAFLLLTGGKAEQQGGEKGVRVLTANHVAVVILLLLSYLIRSEMMLLTFPMLMLCFLFRFVFTCTADIGIANKAHIINVFKKYLTLLITLIMLLLLAASLNRLGYASSEWKTFTEFFDARTELYDFNSLPSYAGNEAFYQKIGMSNNSQKLLENYNFGLDEKIDADTLTEIATYSKEQREAKAGPFLTQLKRAVRTYLSRLAHPYAADEDETDALWKMTVLVIYILAFFVGIKHHILWKLGLLFACRTTLWLYILYRNRVPVRISHSLYFVELMILIGLLIVEGVRAMKEKSEGSVEKKQRNIIAGIVSITAVIVCVLSLPSQGLICKQEEELRLQNTKPFDILFSYMEEQTDSFYFMDVYSWVPYTEKLFVTQHFNNESYLKNSPYGGMNYDLMGGWVTFSPAADRKIQALGSDNMKEALMQDNVFYVQKSGMNSEWIKNYYAECGYDIVVEQYETVGQFEILQIRNLTDSHEQ